jgi:Cu+-exporting ATPase
MTTAMATLCSGCGRAIDPLRAGHVAILAGRFHYFCGSACKAHYQLVNGGPSPDDVATAQPPEVAFGQPSMRPPASSKPSIPPSTRPAASSTPSIHPSMPAAAPAEEDPGIEPGVDSAKAAAPRAERLQLAVDCAGVALGVLAGGVQLLGGAADVARVPLAAAAWLALVVRCARAPRDPADPHPLVVLLPAGVAVLAAAGAALVHDPRAVGISVFAGLASAVAIAVERLVCRGRVRVVLARERIERALDVEVKLLHGDNVATIPASEVRPGEQIVVDTNEVVGVDATVIAGEARVAPWLDARTIVVKREGDPIVAGARIVTNRLRLTTTWSGRERAWVRLLSVPSARIDVAAPTARALRYGVERGAPIAAGLVGVAAFAGNATAVEIVAYMAAGAMAFAVRAVPSFAGLHFARAHLDALACGITYKDPRAFERAGATDVAVLSARGTVLLGEPEIVAIETIGGGMRASERAGERLSERPASAPSSGPASAPSSGPASPSAETDDVGRVLSLAAGAETASTHPFAAAILRAARARGVRADHVRNATVHAGLGITALASTGERLVVGGRAIMLEEKIGGAMADARVSELEAQGCSVLLVALGDRLVGLIALQDGLRAGARATVQKLLDAGIEPVLLSGEARETCETISRALDIDHVRPEVLPADRGAEVRALAEGGGVISVIGHPAMDDGALGAADVAVAMGAAGSTPGEWAIALASDDVRDAADALAIPHATRKRVWTAIGLGAAPGFVALLAIGFGIAPLAVAPLAVLLGAVAAAVHARESAPRG